MDGLSVCVIDDDLAVRRGLTRLLETCGYRVEAYASPREFLRDATLSNFDCILMDVRMPGLTGFDLYDRLTTAGCRVPVIFITGHADADMAGRALRSESVKVLVKPFDEQALFDAIRHAVETARRTGHSTGPNTGVAAQE
jgi:FixJ family two-component response regulator